MQHVVLQKRFHRIDILFRAHMLMCREICHDVKALFGSKHFCKHRRRKVHGIGNVILRDKHILCRSQIPGQLCQRVLVSIHHHKMTGFKWQDRFDKGRSDGTGSSYYQHRLVCDLPLKQFTICLDIRGKHADRTLGNVIGNESI